MMNATVADNSLVAATPIEHDELVEVARLLAPDVAVEEAVLEVNGRRVRLPASARSALGKVAGALAQDQAIMILPYQKLLTTQQAADLLNVSRPYLVKLLDEGEFPYSMTGTHRRVRFDDLMTYKVRRDEERGQRFADLVRLTEELDLYSEDDNFGPARGE